MAKNKFHSGPGPSQRQLRVGELIRRVLSETLSKQALHDPDLDGVPITVGEVRVSPDLKTANVYVLPLGGLEVDRIIDALDRNKIALRKLVTRDLKLKFSPNLRFLADTTFDQMDETSRLLALEEVQRDTRDEDQEETSD
jgi:ribosome-binding factor A